MMTPDALTQHLNDHTARLRRDADRARTRHGLPSRRTPSSPSREARAGLVGLVGGHAAPGPHTVARVRRQLQLAVVVIAALALTVAGTAAPAPAHAAGAPAVTAQAVDVRLGPDSSSPSGLVAWDGGLYFSAYDGFRCNGVPVVGSEIGDDLGEYGRELFTVAPDGSLQLVADVNPRVGGNCDGVGDPFDIRRAPMDDALVFTGTNFNTTGQEPYRTQGTAATTQVVRNIAAGTEPSFPVFYGTVLGGTAVAFQAERVFTEGDEPWITDGTSAGTALVADIAQGGGDSAPRMFTELSPTEFVFVADDATGTTGRELYVSDGSGASLVHNINPVQDAGIENLTTFQGRSKVVFRASDGTSGAEPWVSDGTAAGTVRLADINVGLGSSSPGGFVQVGDQMFFAASMPATGTELWVTDGTPAGTRLVADINPGSGSGYFANSGVAYKDKLFFRGPGLDMWFSDGTAAGTAATEIGMPPVRPTVVGDVLFFSSAFALWATDGTPAGTQMVVGGLLESPTALTAVGTSMLGFIGRDSAHGIEPWIARFDANAPPVAVDDEAVATRDEPTVVDVLANDTDETPETLTAELLTQPAHGTATLTTAQEISYTHEAGFSGEDSFTYRACDAHGACSEPATVTISVPPPPNQPPVADAGGPYLGAVNTAIALDATASSDPDGDPLTFSWTAGGADLTNAGTAAPAFTATQAGIYSVTVEACDAGECDTAESTVTVYDPDGGFVSGGGSIDSPAGSCGPAAPPGTCGDDPSGRARFAFVAKYRKGAQAPEGETAFNFRDAGLEFTSDSYDWLVVAGQDRAQFKGTGLVNGEPGYSFLLTAHDGGTGGTDGFRIKITNADGVVYDNNAGADDQLTPTNTQAITAGNVVIHRK